MKLDLLKQLADMVTMCGSGDGVKDSVEPLFEALIVSHYLPFANYTLFARCSFYFSLVQGFLR